jgi:hypothetical protein
MHLDVDSKEFIKLLTEIEKRKPRRKSKKFVQSEVELYYLMGQAIFVVDNIEVGTPAKGNWRGKVSFPKSVLTPYLTIAPKDATIKFAYEDGKIQIENFKMKAVHNP